jgi:hypothetical protein
MLQEHTSCMHFAMLERSVSSTPGSVEASHTESDQWQSFEGRMRRRRAERCLARASAALDAGLIEDARQAWAEAKDLDPTSPALAALETGIARRAPPENAVDLDVPPETVQAGGESGRSRRVGAVLAASAVVALAALAAGRTWTRPFQEPTRSSPARTDIALGAPAGISEPAPVSLEPPLQPADPEPAPIRDAVPPPEPLEPAARADVPPASVDVPRDSRPVELVPPADPVPLEPSALPAVDITPPAAAPPPAAALPARADITPAAAAVESESTSRLAAATAAIRRTLDQYEAAYSQLDASAARAVWPTVDQRALARAFDGLAAQEISLNACDVLVNGATARATCSGQATWTAKVGGGRQTQPRRWAFELRSADGTWQIVRADTR